MEPSFCFICLEGLKVKTGRKRKEELMKTKKGESEFNLLINYLLQTRSKTYDTVFKDILKLAGNGHATNKVESKETQVNQLVRLCEKCEIIGAKLLELHLELEKIQMRIINEVRSVRRAVVNSSGWLGGIGKEDGSEGFKRFSKRFCGEVITSKKQKELYKVLKAFQTAITEIDADSVHIPLVYLDKYKIAVPADNPNIFLGTVPDIVKTEPVDTESFQDIVESSDTSSDFYEEMCQEIGKDESSVKKQFETTPSISSVLTRSRTQIKPKIKSEFDPHLKSEKEDGEEKSLKKTNRGGRKRKKTKNGSRRGRRPKQTVLEELRRKKRGAELRQLHARQGSSKPVNVLQRVSKSYHCASCGFSCRYLSRFEQHLREHETEEKEFHCDKCNVGFTNQQLHFLHENRHKGLNKFKCDVCLSYIDAFDFSTHLKTHVKEVFPCPYCSYCSSSRDKHLIHIDVKHARLNVTCDICGESFESKKLLVEHLIAVHKAIENIKCDFEECNKTFSSRRALTIHKNVHTDRFACKVCQKPFCSKLNLQAHEQYHHGQVQEKPIKCDQCPEAFAGVPLLQAHLIRDHGAPKYECNICGKKYLTRPALRFHMGKNHNIGRAKCKCTICNKNFGIPSKLRLHMERCHSKGPNYVCEKCGKTFLSRPSYTLHKKIHGEKTQKCPFCPKAFTQNTVLRQHIKTHTNEKSFVCEFCGKAFTQSHTRKAHRKKCQLQPTNLTGNPTESTPAI